MRPIDADALVAPSGCYNPIKWCHEYGDVVSLEDIQNAPTIEPKSGSWKFNDAKFGKPSFKCSVCGEIFDNVPTLMMVPLFKYCPDCGARLKGV